MRLAHYRYLYIVKQPALVHVPAQCALPGMRALANEKQRGQTRKNSELSRPPSAARWGHEAIYQRLDTQWKVVERCVRTADAHVRAWASSRTRNVAASDTLRARFCSG